MENIKKWQGNHGHDTMHVHENKGRVYEIQEQEIMIVSKQSFHMLSHVCVLLQQYDKAARCLQRIEMYIDEQRHKEDELYNRTLEKLDSKHTSSRQPHSSTFALEGKAKRNSIKDSSSTYKWIDSPNTFL